METIIQFFLHLDANLAIYAQVYGYWIYFLIFSIIFLETACLVTAFLPGDSLLFAAGSVAATGGLNIYILLLGVFLSGTIGNAINYWIGKRFHHFLFLPNGEGRFRFFNKEHLLRTQKFYERYGGKTLVIGCFIPIIRTFAPFVAGMVEMRKYRFMCFNILGISCWITLVLYGAYLFGNVPWVKHHFSIIILFILIISVLPVVIGYRKKHSSNRA